MAEVSQLVLLGKNMSGRGIRFRPISPSDHDQVTIDAAKGLDQSSTVIELKKCEWRLGARRMIVGVTKESGLTDPLAKGATWRKISAMEIDDEYDRLFNAKDDAAISELYRKYHEVTQDEIDILVGKVIAVSVD